MKKILSLLLVVSLCLGLFSGCGRRIDNSAYKPTGDAILMDGEEPEDILVEEEAQELTLAYYPEKSLNPLFGSDYTNRILMSLMYQPLFAVDNKKNPTPILAGKYQVSANSRNITVWLDENATYSDGSRVTPEDVVATYWQAKENDYYMNRFRHLINIEVTEDGSGILFQMEAAYR
jgi:ABC-type transport system substrate-binding protein